MVYHASRHSAGQPIVAGWAYSWIAQVGFARAARAAQENSNVVAAEQIKAFLP
jgi:hypothetical protein